MKWLLLLGLFSAGQIAMPAESPPTFAWHAPLAVAASAPYQRFTLPQEAYLHAAQFDLRDLRVFNADGVPVPIARTQQAGASEKTTVRTALRWFPLTSTAPATTDANHGALSVRVRIGTDGTLVEVKSNAKQAGSREIRRGYVLDASHLEKRANAQALTLDWLGVSGFQLLDVAASDNLQDWRSVRSGVQLARLDYNGQRIENRSIELAGLPGRYLRLLWRDPAAVPELISAQIEETTAFWRSPPTEWFEPLAPGKGTLTLQAGEFHYRLPKKLPVTRIRLLLPPGNVLLPLEMLQPDRERRHWHPLTRAVAYRINDDGREWLHDEIALPGWPLGEFILRFDTRSHQTDAPQVQVGIEPEQLVFLAEGRPPYTLALGNAKAVNVALPLTTLVPELGSSNTPKIGEAKVLPASLPAAIASQPGTLRQTPVEIDWKKAALWGVLLAGVLAMGAMAWKLVRQMQSDSS